MAVHTPTAVTTQRYPPQRHLRGSVLLSLLRTTDHKQIGMLYVVTSFGFFMIGGAMAMLIRGELARPGLQFLSTEQYNQLFTMHGTIMLLLYATPILFGFANLVLPLQIGSPDVAFPRLNALSYWLFLFGGLIVVSGFLTPAGAADFGWFAYAPLNGLQHSPGAGVNLWIMGLVLAGLGTILATGAVLLPFFAFTSFLIAVPTGIKFFNWIGTMWRGQLTFETPMLFSIGFLVTFLQSGCRLQ